MLCMFAPASLYAAGAGDQITAEIEALHIDGVELHRKYNMADDDQMRACAQKSAPLRARAQKLRPEIMALGSMSLRMSLTLAADDAFACVYCSERATEACSRIAADLAGKR